MTKFYFKLAYKVLNSNALVKSQGEFCEMLGLERQWLACLGRRNRPEPRIREKTVHRLRQRLNEFEQTVPRPLKPMITDLINRLDAEERVASTMRLGR
ncbi:hypothetical protein [Bosea sp. (in: a-proteobacteria)]|uniref:hypothetical protein n=1 Tax=Bosea sp. (in: a-proteobacteria) TaxID=1871050 RepID=UPI001AC4BA85|nr:hypothetical protein [Bosea sp. (in: a-proteobacteria)]MBN9437161.1 hypothetical protein [Bosea sp. (in: a-proteobacteria)]